LKILFVSNGYPPRQWAGTETYTAGIAQELQKRGHQVQVLCGGDWDNGPSYWNGCTDEEYQGVSVRRLHLNWMKAPDPFRYLYDNRRVADYTAGYLAKIQPDLVHVTSCERLSASVLRAVKRAGLPLVLSLTDFWFLCPQITLLRSDGENCDGLTTAWDCLRCKLYHTKAYRWPSLFLSEQSVSRLLTAVSKHPTLTRQRGLRGYAGDMQDRKIFLRQALSLTDERITASHFVHDLFVENGVELPIRVQPYGHDLSWLRGYVGKSASTNIRIGFIGQILPSKGVHLLLRAASELQDELGDRFSLLVYGNMDKQPEYSVQLRELASTVKCVQFCGTYAHEDSARIFTNLDILVVPSVWYDFPLIVYEAFATKTPVIATNLGGMAEAVQHGVTGLLFERGDVDDLAKQIRQLIENPSLAKSMKNQIPPVKTIAEEVNEFETIYHQLTNSDNEYWK
jgi:glycosyltransferase involved in cell wall biosynthesis